MKFPYRLGWLPRPFWVRFGRAFGPVTQNDVDEKREFLVVGYRPKTDEIILMSPTPRPPDVATHKPEITAEVWCLEALLCAEAEYNPDPWRGGSVWAMIGYCLKNGQLKPGDCEDTEP